MCLQSKRTDLCHTPSLYLRVKSKAIQTDEDWAIIARLYDARMSYLDRGPFVAYSVSARRGAMANAIAVSGCAADDRFLSGKT